GCWRGHTSPLPFTAAAHRLRGARPCSASLQGGFSSAGIRLNDDFHAAILGTSFRCVVWGNRLVLPIPNRFDLPRRETPVDQILSNRPSAFHRELLIERRIAG